MSGWLAEVICRRSHYYHYWGLAAVAGLSLGLRFWGLGRFDEWVFDEVYYVQFARAYLAGETVFDAHPPLGKYAIALGIGLSSHLPWAEGGESALTAVSYRWMNAFVGSLIPLLVVGICRTLTGQVLNRQTPNHQTLNHQTLARPYFALLAGGFVAIDGLFITESRYALINIYVVFFGLLGHWLWLRSRLVESKRSCLYHLLSGVAVGAAAATKWNGLGYVLSLLVWEGWQFADRDAVRHNLKSAHKSVHNPAHNPVQMSVLVKSILYRALCLGLVPLLTYCLVWWPHLRLNGTGFWALHRGLFLFHQGLDTVQSACSGWFTWPLLLKPIPYWYEAAGERVYVVNNLGNPALWWLSGAAVLLVGANKVLECRQRRPARDGVTTYLLIGYLANWLPWVVVGRCTYIYLFMPAAVFGFALLAWLLSGWLVVEKPRKTRLLGGLLLSVIALSFFFWLPLSLGLPLTPEQLQLRWWLPSWT